jgi:hypothetical protein
MSPRCWSWRTFRSVRMSASIRDDPYAERLATAGVLASIGSVGDSFDNVMAESVIGCRRPWANNLGQRWTIPMAKQKNLAKARHAS